jgi:hypothetical protein
MADERRISSGLVEEREMPPNGVDEGSSDIDPDADPTPQRIHGKRRAQRGKTAAKWIIALTQREEQMLQRLVDHFDYPRAILGRMLLRDAYRELFAAKPATIGATEE